MLDEKSLEHYCTLFNSAYLPMGMSLISSLGKNQKDSAIFVLCLDDETHHALQELSISNVNPIKLCEIEDYFPELLESKGDKKIGEYCWTLTSHICLFLLEKFKLCRITYLDADLFFLKNPMDLIDEMLSYKKHVLITEHGYDPKYNQEQTSGRFCVQFVTFQNTDQGLKVLKWWKDRCIEWCYARFENGKFGDQKYLDQWPILFEEDIHILKDKNLTLAPWNVNFRLGKSKISPVFYHFHGFKFLSEQEVVLYTDYKVGKMAKEIYVQYVKSICSSILKMKNKRLTFSFPIKNKWDIKRYISNKIKKLMGKYEEADLRKLMNAEHLIK